MYMYICVYIYIYICIFRQHFFVNANFIKHNRHFMSTYFLLDPFEFPYYFYCIPSTRKYVDIKLCLMKFALTKKCCLNIHILNFMILQLINITALWNTDVIS